VLDDQVVAGLGEGCDRAMKSVEEPRTLAAHSRMHAAPKDPKSGVGKLVGGIVTKGLREDFPERLCQR
jgi:hypothetical protein